MYLQDGNLHNIQEKSLKDMLPSKENIKTLESQLQNKDQRNLIPPQNHYKYIQARRFRLYKEQW